MKSVKELCKLQENALSINVGNQIEQLEQIITGTNGRDFFKKTFITEGMKKLLSAGMARLAAKSSDCIFHLKQAMGGGKTHIMVGFGLLAKDKALRAELASDIPYQSDFGNAKIAAFNGRNQPANYFWGSIATQLDKPSLFKQYWENGAKAPDEEAWLKLFDTNEPILILLDELPPYFDYYTSQVLGNGTVATVVTRAFSNMLTAAQKRNNVCIVVSDLDAAYETGTNLIKSALSDAKQELGRAVVNITPVNLESNEIYEILRKRLFVELPDTKEIAEIAEAYANRLSEAARAHTVERTAELITNEIEATYPFHPSFKSIVALFKENEKFKQTRGLMELVSRLLKSVWESEEDVYLIGAQHFDLAIPEVREKLSEISDMRAVIAKDLWESNGSAHTQIIDGGSGNKTAAQVGTMLFMASLSTAVNSVKGLTEQELLQFLINPQQRGGDFKPALNELLKKAWYLHQNQDGRIFFDRQENLTKKLEGYAEKASQNNVDRLICERLTEMYKPITKEAYEKVMPLPLLDDALAAIKNSRVLLIISPDGNIPPSFVANVFDRIDAKNNVLVLTGDKSSMANLDHSARQVYAAKKADNEITSSHPQRKEFEEKVKQYDHELTTVILNVFDKVMYPGNQGGKDFLRSKVLNGSYDSNEKYNGENQIIKTLTEDPKKLYTDISADFDAVRSKAESLLFGNIVEVAKSDLIDNMRRKTQMSWLPPKGLELLINEACKRGLWETTGNLVSKKPKPKQTEVMVSIEAGPDDNGEVRLRVETVNAGNSPTIYYCEDGEVTVNSDTLSDNTLVTRAMKVQFLAVDSTGKNETGKVKQWQNRLVIRNKFDSDSRMLELFVAPRGIIKYTLDGSEARNGQNYTGPVKLDNGKVSVYVFAECDGIEDKRTFTFDAKGVSEVNVVREKPAEIHAGRPKKVDATAKIFEALKFADERGMEFESADISAGSDPKVIRLSFGAMRIKPAFISEELEKMRQFVEPDSPTIFTFKTLYCKAGHDLEEFAKVINMEIKPGEVVQE